MPAATESPLKSLIDQVGGENQFNFLIQAYCENIQDDEDLRMVLKGIETERLVELMTNLLNMSFAYSSEASLNDEGVRSRIVLKNYTLFKAGLSSARLSKLQDHFEAALHDSWVEGEVFEQCTQRFSSLRTIFEEERTNMPTSPLMGFNRKVVSARSA